VLTPAGERPGLAGFPELEDRHAEPLGGGVVEGDPAQEAEHLGTRHGSSSA
jgi:hypothetical protein